MFCRVSGCPSVFGTAFDQLSTECLKTCLVDFRDVRIENKAYLSLFGIQAERYSVKAIFKHLLSKVSLRLSSRHVIAIQTILENGSLSTRILKAIQKEQI